MLKRFLITKKFSTAFRHISSWSQPLVFPTIIIQTLRPNSSITNTLYKALISNIGKIILQRVLVLLHPTITAGLVVTNDVNIVNNEDLISLIMKEP